MKMMERRQAHKELRQLRADLSAALATLDDPMWQARRLAWKRTADPHKRKASFELLHEAHRLLDLRIDETGRHHLLFTLAVREHASGPLRLRVRDPEKDRRSVEKAAQEAVQLRALAKRLEVDEPAVIREALQRIPQLCEQLSAVAA